MKSPTKRTPRVKGSNEKEGPWTDDEISRFLSALEEHGRNWEAVTAAVGTRGKENVRSRAQRHFIRLAKDGKPLPAKVAESGSGYTLSGKELDPSSAAAARIFGLPPPPKREKVPGGEGEVIEDTNNQPGPLKTPKSMTKPKQKRPPSAEVMEKRKKMARQASEKRRAAREAYEDDGRTGYSASRLRDSSTRKHYHAASAGESLMFVEMEYYTGEPACGKEGSQPFTCSFGASALLAADLHAHLERDEIIGFLAGTWDDSLLHIHVQVVFPCRAVATQDGRGDIFVEVDPVSEMEVRSRVEAMELQIVGWYHSHPTFMPNPSLRDIETHANYQTLFFDARSAVAPFVGWIVAPFVEGKESEATENGGTTSGRTPQQFHLPGGGSLFAAFNVQEIYPGSGQGMHLSYSIRKESTLDADGKAALDRLISLYGNGGDEAHHVVDFAESLGSAGSGGGEGESFGERFVSNLRKRVPMLFGEAAAVEILPDLLEKLKQLGVNTP